MTVHEGPYFDSTGKLIQVGDRVRFRGQNYTIAAFEPGAGRLETARICFSEPCHFPEAADEISVDLIRHETQ